MRFIADRKQMLAVCRNLARLVPETSPIEDLTGIMIEADENSGTLRLVATNMETALEYRREAVVAEGGRMVLNGSLLAGMMPLLSDDRVSFETRPGSNAARIVCGSARYALSYLPGNHFPEPKTLTPENTVRLAGLAGLIRQTAFAAKKKATTPNDMLANARLDVYPTEAHMTCTDGLMLAIARQKQENAGRSSLLVPAASLTLLAGVCGEQAVEAGTNGSSLVFKGDGFAFTTRTMRGIYPDTNALLSQVRPVYDALVNARGFWEDVDRVNTVSMPGSHVRITLRENGAGIFYESELGRFSTVTDAVVYNDMPGEGFYYNADDLSHALRYMEGTLQIGIDRTGNMLLKGQNLCYLLTPRRASKRLPEQTVQKKPKKKTKAKKTADAADKAA